MTALPYLVGFDRPRGMPAVWLRPDDVASVEPVTEANDDAPEVLVFLSSGRAYVVVPPQGDDFISDAVEAVCRRLAGLPLCDGAHPEPFLRQVPAFDPEREQGQIDAMKPVPTVDHLYEPGNVFSGPECVYRFASGETCGRRQADHRA